MVNRNYKVSGKKMLMNAENAFMLAGYEFWDGAEISAPRTRQTRLNSRQTKKLFTKGEPHGINERAVWRDYMYDLEEKAYAGYY